MFFEISKISWQIVEPGNLFLLLLLGGTFLLWTRWSRAGRFLLTVVAFMGLAIATFPVGQLFIAFLEDRFPPPRPMPEKVDGIITLTGGIDRFVAAVRKRLPNDGGERRITEFVLLAQRYPAAKLVVSGGSPDLLKTEVVEADVIAEFLRILGLDPARVIFEQRSRNTYEHAVETYKLLSPKPDETWLLVTSARHMPRAMGCFRNAGWKILPYPVGFHTTGADSLEPTFKFIAGWGQVTFAFYELLGLVAYRLTGRTDALIPGAND